MDEREHVPRSDNKLPKRGKCEILMEYLPDEQQRKVDEREQVPRRDNTLPKRGKDGVGAGTSCKEATKSCRGPGNGSGGTE
nr:hypothetical protein [Tanacetum cinerariifolium]